MAFITTTALLCTTISAVTIQVLTVSSGTKKGNKKGVTNNPIDASGNLLKENLFKKQPTAKATGIKRPPISKCKNVLKIHDFVLYPLKAVIPVTGVYIVSQSKNINFNRKTTLFSDNIRLKTNKQSLNYIKTLQTTTKLTRKPKNKKKTVKKSQSSNTVKKHLTKTIVKRRRKSKHIKAVKRKTTRKSAFITCEPPRSTVSSDKVLTTKEVNRNTMVLSADQFVFRPAIPINETNYPIDNAEKLELYAQDSPVDKVLSYSFTDPLIKNYIKFPSVSKIIEETISDKTKQILANWRQKMIDDLGEDGFYNHSEALKVRGTEFHMAVRNAVLGNSSENRNCSEVTQNSLKSLSWMLEHISNPLAVESTIAHPKLGYRGVADCIAMFRNIPVIIDWKLSDKPKRDLKDTYDAPVQITAYIGALNHDPNYKWGVNHGLVAVAYANGDPCDVFLLAPKHCQIYWRHWLMRFDKFKARSHLHLDHNIDEKSLELI